MRLWWGLECPQTVLPNWSDLFGMVPSLVTERNRQVLLFMCFFGGFKLLVDSRMLMLSTFSLSPNANG